ncbi:MAG: hypothetical protein IT464_07890 [Planctomycetes bacterium]|nr:hypothetical protein [Planctomycetota bacterium]
MRKLMLLILAVASLAMAACGGGNTTNGPAGNAPANDGHSHGHGDEHGKAHDLGKKKSGDYEVQVGQVESDSKTEGVFEIKVMKDGKVVKDVPAEAWIGNSAGKELSPVAKGEWMEDEQLLDCHVALPADMKEARLWVRIRPTGVKLDPVDFELDKD